MRGWKKQCHACTASSFIARTAHIMRKSCCFEDAERPLQRRLQALLGSGSSGGIGGGNLQGLLDHYLH